MVKKEINEIRKLMSPGKTVFTEIRGCYVAADGKQKISRNNDKFPLLPEEEANKYLEICRKALTGKVDKTLHNLSFPAAEETDGGVQALLSGLLRSSLKDEKLVDDFYDRVISCHTSEANYYIVLAYGIYDVPKKKAGKNDIDDVSDTVFPFIQCCICPVSLSNGNLGYQEKKNRIGECPRGWLVGVPESGFLFPLFNDRATDVHGVLYYCKKDEGLKNGLITELLHCTQPISAAAQKSEFTSIVEQTLGENCGFGQVTEIQSTLGAMDEGQKISVKMLKTMLESCGADKAATEQLNHIGIDFSASNIAEKGCKVKAPGVSIQADADTALCMEEKIIGGRRCLVIPLEGDVEVNGIAVRPQK